jgi:hypothetical protein
LGPNFALTGRWGGGRGGEGGGGCVCAGGGGGGTWRWYLVPSLVPST